MVLQYNLKFTIVQSVLNVVTNLYTTSEQLSKIFLAFSFVRVAMMNRLWMRTDGRWIVVEVLTEKTALLVATVTTPQRPLDVVERVCLIYIYLPKTKSFYILFNIFKPIHFPSAALSLVKADR